jgi:peptide/nickel transport system substrate-binding protein
MQGKDYDMSLIAHVEARDIPALFGNPDYYLGFDSERVRALLADADRAPEDQYPTLMKEAVAEIMDEAAANTLFNFPNIVVTRRGVEGMPVNTVTDELRLAGISKGGN